MIPPHAGGFQPSYGSQIWALAQLPNASHAFSLPPSSALHPHTIHAIARMHSRRPRRTPLRTSSTFQSSRYPYELISPTSFHTLPAGRLAESSLWCFFGRGQRTTGVVAQPLTVRAQRPPDVNDRQCVYVQPWGVRVNSACRPKEWRMLDGALSLCRFECQEIPLHPPPTHSPTSRPVITNRPFLHDRLAP